MAHRRWSIQSCVFLFMLVALLPVSVVAQDSDTEDEGSVIVHVYRPVAIDAGETVDVAVVVNDDATIDGEVSDALVVVNGTVTVTGTVGGVLYVAEGSLILEETATVEDVMLYNSDLTRAEGATVTGTLDEDANLTAVGEGFAAISLALRVALGISILIVSLLIMAIFARPIQRAAATISAQPLPSAVAGLGAWVVLFFAAIIAIVTLIGIPVGLAIFLFLMPFLALMGHIVASYWVGSRLAGLMNLRLHPYVLFIVGLVLVQIVSAIPFIGGLVVFIVSLLGTGALVLYLWRARQPPAPEPVHPGPVGDHATV